MSALGFYLSSGVSFFDKSVLFIENEETLSLMMGLMKVALLCIWAIQDYVVTDVW